MWTLCLGSALVSGWKPGAIEGSLLVTVTPGGADASAPGKATPKFMPTEAVDGSLLFTTRGVQSSCDVVVSKAHVRLSSGADCSVGPDLYHLLMAKVLPISFP